MWAAHKVTKRASAAPAPSELPCVRTSPPPWAYRAGVPVRRTSGNDYCCDKCDAVTSGGQQPPIPPNTAFGGIKSRTQDLCMILRLATWWFAAQTHSMGAPHHTFHVRGHRGADPSQLVAHGKVYQVCHVPR